MALNKSVGRKPPVPGMQTNSNSKNSTRTNGNSVNYVDSCEHDDRDSAVHQPGAPELDSDGEEVYEVEAIVDDKPLGGTHYYCLKWKSYPSEENTWEPVENLSCTDLIREYEEKKKLREQGSMYQKGFLLSKVFNIPKCHNIRVINTVDNARLPEGFKYTDGYIRGDKVPYPSGVVFPCSCTGEKCGPSCECVETPCYDENGRLCVDLELQIHECNYLCKCSIKCPNRTVQRGNKIYIDVIRTAQKGWGAITRKDIYKGEYICRYTGALITFEESTKIDVADSTYIFDLDSEIPANMNCGYAIDACNYGNVSHFFNHSCDPNLVIRSVYINHLDPLMHELAFFALRDIKVGEELTFDYSPLVVISQQYLDDLEKSKANDKQFRCYCGTAKCRKIIFPNMNPAE